MTMIDLHERLSEFSYGFGASREVEQLLRDCGFHTTPFLPSLLHEAQLGFDVAFSKPGVPIVLQFKLGQELQRFRRTSPSAGIPELDRPFWRYFIDTQAPQFVKLLELEQEPVDAYYVAPRFSHWEAYEQVFQSGHILDSSLLIAPSAIRQELDSQGATSGAHRIVYDAQRQYVCSDPVEIEARKPETLVARVVADIREKKVPLRQRIERIVEQPRPYGGATGLAVERRQAVLSQARRRIDGLAAILGLEVWSMGGQLLYVTEG